MNNGCATSTTEQKPLPDKLRESISELQYDRVDVLFRCYDLLFRSYPLLRKNLPKNRYKHPDLIALFEDAENHDNSGASALQHLIDNLNLKSRYETKKFLRLTRQNMLQAIDDVMFDSVTESHTSTYKYILDSKLQQF